MGKKKKTIAQIKQELKTRYGARNVYGWSGYVDDAREAEVLKLMEKIAKELDIIPSYFNTIAIGEGLGAAHIDHVYGSTPPFEVDINKEVSGFGALGVDDFGSEFSRYKKHLPTDYNEGDEFTKSNQINELGQKVTSGKFKNLESALWAFGATLVHRRDTFRQHAKELGYNNPTEDQEAYWTYVYYQGEGRAKKYVKSNGDLDFTKKPPLNMNEIKQLALERVATWRYVQTKKIFSQ